MRVGGGGGRDKWLPGTGWTRATTVGCLRYTSKYQIKLGWETHKYDHENVELPDPRPTQPKKNQVKSGIWATFSPQQMIFRGLGLDLYRKQTTRNLTQPNSPQTPYYFTGEHNNKDQIWLAKKV